jgi:adenosylhomocysteine nucleosidase
MFLFGNQKVVVGQIASGDQFFLSSLEKENFLGILPDVLFVEMEAAAVGQVCFEYDVMCMIIRIISGSANENSVVDFNDFVV